MGSPYAVYGYHVDPRLGGDEGLATLRGRLADLGLRLILDFVPNHLSRDHPWLMDHPERLMQVSQNHLQTSPNNAFSTTIDGWQAIFVHGRDPNYEGWTDTVQLDYRKPTTRQAMTEILRSIADRSDGVRCDMAMLATREVFLRTWGGEMDPPGSEFWPEAIASIKRSHPDFVMLAEVYWDMEYDLIQQGFDYVYDKRLYERLLGSDPAAVRTHLTASLDYQRHLMRFIENHDEQTAVEAFGTLRSMAAATLALGLPGMRHLGEGQLDGRRIRIPVQLGRCQPEPVEPELSAFYSRLLDALSEQVFHDGDWKLLEPREEWAGNASHRNFIAYAWMLGEQRRLVVVNLGGLRSQCFLPLGSLELAGKSCRLRDLLSDVEYVRDGDELVSRGLFFSLPAYGHHLFEVEARPKKIPESVQNVQTLPGRGTDIYSLAWSPDGKRIVSATRDGAIAIWNVDDPKSFRILSREHTDVISSVAWSPDGRRLALGSNDRMVWICEAESGSQVRCLQGHWDNVLSVAWSPQERLVASGAKDRRAIVWDVETGTPVHVYWEQTDAINCVAWSPDGKLLAAGSGDRSIRIWDVSNHTVRHVLMERDWVGSVAWSPDGRLLASGTGGGAISLWDPETGAMLASGKGTRAASSPFPSVPMAAFSHPNQEI